MTRALRPPGNPGVGDAGLEPATPPCRGGFGAAADGRRGQEKPGNPCTKRHFGLTAATARFPLLPHEVLAQCWPSRSEAGNQPAGDRLALMAERNVRNVANAVAGRPAGRARMRSSGGVPDSAQGRSYPRVEQTTGCSPEQVSEQSAPFVAKRSCESDDPNRDSDRPDEPTQVAAIGDQQLPRGRGSGGRCSGVAGTGGRWAQMAASDRQQPARARRWLLATPRLLADRQHLMRASGEERVLDQFAAETCCAAHAVLAKPGTQRRG